MMHADDLKNFVMGGVGEGRGDTVLATQMNAGICSGGHYRIREGLAHSPNLKVGGIAAWRH